MTPGERREKLERLSELQYEMAEIQEQLSSKPPPSYPITTEVNFGRCKDDNWDIAHDQLGFEEDTDAERQCVCSLLEINVTVDINEDGSVMLTECEGVPLTEKVNLSYKKGA